MVSPPDGPFARPLRLLRLEHPRRRAPVAVESALTAAGLLVEQATRARGREQFEKALATAGAAFDVIVADDPMPEYPAREALAYARSVRPEIPFIILAATASSEERVVEMLHEGAADYVVERRLARLGPAVERALRLRAPGQPRPSPDGEVVGGAPPPPPRGLWERIAESRPVLEGVLAQLVSGVALAQAPGGEVVLATARFCEIAGVPRDALRSLTDLGCNLPLRADGTRYALPELACIEALVSGAQPPTQLQHFERPWPHVAAAAAAPLRGEDGQLLAVVASLTDVTEQLALEAACDELRLQVEDERETCRAVIDRMQEALVMIDAERRVRMSNPVARELLGASLAQGASLPTARYRMFRRGSDAPCPTEERPLFRALRDGAVVREEEYELHPLADGAAEPAPVRTVQLTAAPIRDRAGRIRAAVGTLHDVTELRRLEAELREQLRVRDRILSVVSHDLRTPLGTITMSAHTVQRQATDARIRRSIELIGRSAAHMERITADLLEVGRLRAGETLSVRREPADVRIIAVKAIEEAAAAHPATPIELQAEPGAFQAAVDVERIAQAVGNLLSNAARYGEPKAPVQVALRRSGECDVEICVRNRGPPIPADLLPHIFEPFRRATGAQTAGSVGLGLFIVHQIAVAHGGAVAARSTLEAGTEVTIRLPGLRRSPRAPLEPSENPSTA